MLLRMFTLKKTTPLGRRASLTTEHGVIETPFFMPVGTAGAMKGITHDELLELEAQILLCNTYHLHLRPGEETVADAGGLHAFIGWNKPILTDSGGFQVYSFGKKGRTKVTEDGVRFQSHIDGADLFIGPDESMKIQHDLGSDIIMVFDECPPSTASRADIQKAVDKTLRWAERCKNLNTEHKKKTGKKPLLFGIVQGGLERDIREKCAEELIAMDFDGYALGGLAVGESQEEMYGVTEAIAPLLPENKPRYLMGVGVIEQLRTCIEMGIDMFDCVLPMRLARHGVVWTSSGEELRMQNAKYADMHEVIDADSPSKMSTVHLKSYLHHLIKCNERLGETIAGKQNLGLLLHEMKNIRTAMESE